MVCDANGFGGSYRCTLAEGHEGWHQEWEMEDGELQLQIEWRFSRKDELEFIKHNKESLMKCGRQVNLKPWWMGEGQFDPCLCILDKGHEGICKCDHDFGKAPD